jgi:hypothetical protein
MLGDAHNDTDAGRVDRSRDEQVATGGHRLVAQAPVERSLDTRADAEAQLALAGVP